jgi:tetratricopeptide (TPR) repeat protein
MKLGKLLAVVLQLVLLLSQGVFAQASFPGKGSKSNWDAAEVLYQRARDYRQSHDYSSALSSYQQAIAKYPWSYDYYLGAGGTLADLGRLDEAVATYRKAIAVSPGHWQSFEGLANVLFEQKRYAESKEAALKAISLNPPGPKRESLVAGVKYIDSLKTSKQATR